tara:strand:- start:845 stop:1432 length:588 start_codon:yes stop_codon:yes gene_type:complete
MKKSYSLLSANHLDLASDIDNKIESIDYLHFDLTDGVFCPTLGLSILTLEQLSAHKKLGIDVHLLVQNPLDVVKRIKDLELETLIFHQETITEAEFNNLSYENKKIGIALMPVTDIKSLNNYIKHADCVLLLCITPSLFPDEDSKIVIENRVNEFYETFPNFNKRLIVDGGVNIDMLPKLKSLNVTDIVIGSKFF